MRHDIAHRRRHPPRRGRQVDRRTGAEPPALIPAELLRLWCARLGVEDADVRVLARATAVPPTIARQVLVVELLAAALACEPSGEEGLRVEGEIIPGVGSCVSLFDAGNGLVLASIGEAVALAAAVREGTEHPDDAEGVLAVLRDLGDATPAFLLARRGRMEITHFPSWAALVKGLRAGSRHMLARIKLRLREAASERIGR